MPPVNPNPNPNPNPSPDLNPHPNPKLQAPERVGATLSSYMSHPLELVWPGGSWASVRQSAPADTARAPPPPLPSVAQAAQAAQAALPTVALNLTSAQAGGLVESPNPP